ncbi:hypothetical protein EPD60_15425 [Flaviaesturariibacter flavus]|uniref:Lipoprotein n=1 Tax=Flaviaesturariibacter flavus TaxID=2502780 RepID=A0A4R1B3L8_9BACT|nr:hypothetical protein [Flaviaesturariibacter flavus]TCJ12654.1 hypothetical protein EPD60_15425 [Flaviaesturariibacter flavus]
MTRFYCCLLAGIFAGCGNAPGAPHTAAAGSDGTTRRYRGAISNGMKGDSLFFDLSPDGKQLRNLTFKGYWRCSGKLEQMTAGPKGSFPVANGKVKGYLSEPPGGGATAWRFDIDAAIQKSTASGTFRMNINNLGCDTYLLKWTAAAY